MSDQARESLIVGVVGAGTMGAGIAQVALRAGHDVALHDVDHAAIELGRARISDGLHRLVSKGRLTAEEIQRMLESLHDAHALHELAAEADIVVETALEDLGLKRSIFRALGDGCRPDAILATNTSALSVTEIGESSGVPERVLGLHFFNPAPVMPLVEVVVTESVSKSVVDRALAFVDGLRKTPIVSTDAPGFIVNRVNRPFTLEALRMVEAGEAGIEQIDHAVEAAGYPMGPFALMDLVGIDVNLAVATALWEGFDEAVRFTPSDIQRERVASGHVGRKSGEGFYRYHDDKPAGVAWSGGASAAGLREAQILERIELAIINEAYRAAEEGVAQPPDIDRALKLGANHPHGPFERARELGLRQVVEGLNSFEKQYGERYQICRSLWQVASI